ncbi:prolow-density lipoprotein receptor-related protein 1-like isoform X3 [Macrosteles quadrilineatus]|uniref:prolow-density lipoprotein receptor-related protein 1-like isoform X3 n=1 Tax=Macrosteles quadrilineatus TaxID=74068 RepID=UPI0023E27128|nr:prolow-density lipoprotein receptor-related protein 1-like isoform X3 [Macrosteles quadrilineatus]
MDSRIVCLCLLVLFVDKSRTQPVNNTTTGEECISNNECISGKICIAKKCTDLCDGVCGLNTICMVLEGAPVCSCKADYEGDPFTECKPGNAECTDNSMCTTDKSCIGHKCVDPCLDYCGLNTVCRVVNHRPVCACLKGFFLTLDKGCSPKWIPECQTHSHCPEDRSCRLQKCVDPCEDGVCGNNTECHVKNHYPVCSCKVGYIGDAYNECVTYCSTDNKENIQKSIQGEKSFILVNEKKRWWDALTDCVGRGMKLATIENDDEWNFFVETTRDQDEGVWIGGHDFGNYPNFLWISTGLPVVLRWRAGEPTGSNYNCLAAVHHGFTNFDCINRHSFVCEQRKTDT